MTWVCPARPRAPGQEGHQGLLPSSRHLIKEVTTDRQIRGSLLDRPRGQVSATSPPITRRRGRAQWSLWSASAWRETSAEAWAPRSITSLSPTAEHPRPSGNPWWRCQKVKHESFMNPKDRICYDAFIGTIESTTTYRQNTTDKELYNGLRRNSRFDYSLRIPDKIDWL